MIRPKRLTFSGIGRYVDKQVIDFDRMGNLNQVDGLRVETGGSSGTGKSTTFNAMDYLFGVSDVPTTILQSRLTKNGIDVMLEAEIDGVESVISRSKSKGLSVNIGGHIEEGSNKKAEEALDAAIGMARELFRMTYHKRQDERGFFLNFTPKQTYEFLTECLNLDEYKEKGLKADARVTELADQKKLLEQQREVALSALKATQDGIIGLGLAPTKDFDDADIHTLNNSYQTYQKNLKTVEEIHKMDLEGLERDRPNVSMVPFDRSNIENYERAINILKNKKDAVIAKENDRITNLKRIISDLTVEKTRFEIQIKDGERSRQEALTVAQEIKSIRACRCPMCEQDWTSEGARAKEQVLLEKVKELKARIEIGQMATIGADDRQRSIDELNGRLKFAQPPELTEIEEKIKDFNDKLNADRTLEKVHQDGESKKYAAIMNSFSERYKAVLEKQRIEVNALKQQVESAAQTLNAVLNKAQIYKSAIERHETSFRVFKENEAKWQKQVDDTAKALIETEAELELAEEAKKVIKSYLSVSFDDALVSIGDEATRIIRNIPNMSNATIQLEGIKEQANGKIKEEVTAIIHNDGEENVPIKSLSGGEKSAVDLSVDLAVISLIQERSGKGMDLFILDEPFAGLGTVEIEPSIEMLKNCNVNKKIIIVEHNPEVKQMVESRLLVVREGSTSNISEAA